MKIVSFNINGLRSRLHQLEALRDQHDPDIIGLQEIKVHDDAFPRAEVEALGYHVAHYGQKAHYGVALLSKQPPLELRLGFPGEGEEAQRRLIFGRYDDGQGGSIGVYNGYFPQGESRDHALKFPHKARFYADLLTLLRQGHSPDEALVVMGDMNIAPQDLDIGLGEANAKRWLKSGKCSFLPEEREWFEHLVAWGLHDTYREQHPDDSALFSWFDYRSKGFDDEPKRGLRIDFILATAPLMARCHESGIDYPLRGMEKPSDHAPVWARFV